jgi:iron complex outermembrane receptor protein
MPRVTGHVVDEHNNPVENATITIPSAGVFALSDEQGNFAIDNVFPGIHTLYVVHRNFQKFGADVSLVEDMFVTLELDRQG